MHTEEKYYRSLYPLVNWLNETRPIDWVQFMEDPKRLLVEIGFGQGHHLVRWAQSDPSSLFVGIENGWIPVKMLLRKVGGLGLRNVRVIMADASVALMRLFAPKSIDKIICLFPCPWPKERHARRRLFSRWFLRLMNNRLKDHCEALVVTDHQGFMEWVVGNNRDTGLNLKVSLKEPMFDTKYEKKWLAMGQPQFYHLLFQKVAHIEFPLERDLELRVNTLNFVRFEDLTPFSYGRDPFVKAEEIVVDKDGAICLVRFVVAEDGFVQHLWVEVRREEDLWKIRPSKGSMFVPTKGVQLAMDLLYSRLKGVDSITSHS